MGRKSWYGSRRTLRHALVEAFRDAIWSRCLRSSCSTSSDQNRRRRLRFWRPPNVLLENRRQRLRFRPLGPFSRQCLPNSWISRCLGRTTCSSSASRTPRPALSTKPRDSRRLNGAPTQTADLVAVLRAHRAVAQQGGHAAQRAEARARRRSRPEEAIKDPLVLEFLGLKDEYSESDLETALIARLETFLLELGGDFAFIGRQRRLRVGDAWYRLDLLFFHRRLRCLVVIDLKVGELTHADAGQMHLYLNYAREHWMHEGETPRSGSSMRQKRRRRSQVRPGRAAQQSPGGEYRGPTSSGSTTFRTNIHFTLKPSASSAPTSTNSSPVTSPAPRHLVRKEPRRPLALLQARRNPPARQGQPRHLLAQRRKPRSQRQSPAARRHCRGDGRGPEGRAGTVCGGRSGPERSRGRMIPTYDQFIERCCATWPSIQKA